jgi:hypothetical protein
MPMFALMAMYLGQPNRTITPFSFRHRPVPYRFRSCAKNLMRRVTAIVSTDEIFPRTSKRKEFELTAELEFLNLSSVR